MKAILFLATILVSLSPLARGAEAVRISTMILTVPEGVEFPAEVRTITRSEWQKMVGTLAQIKGVPLFSIPSGSLTSGVMTRVEVGNAAPRRFWQRDVNPIYPISSVEYTQTTRPGGFRLVGEFAMNRGANQRMSHTEFIKSAKVHGDIPHGMVLTFMIGEHLFGVMEPE